MYEEQTLHTTLDGNTCGYGDQIDLGDELIVYPWEDGSWCEGTTHWINTYQRLVCGSYCPFPGASLEDETLYLDSLGASCQPTTVESGSWGRTKALYRNP